MNRLRGNSHHRSFTLIELLVVMGIIAILGVLTTVTYRGIAADARLASGRNAVAAVLDNARGLAMKRNKIVLVVFRPRLDGQDQFVEAVFAEYKESGAACVGCPAIPGGPCPCASVVDRFAPIPDVAARPLPRDIKIASPAYPVDVDDEWRIVSHLPTIDQSTGQGERAGEQIAVMFSPGGTLLANNSVSDAARIFVDYDGDGFQDLATGSGSPTQILYATTSSNWPTIAPANFNGQFPNHHGYFEHVFENDEPYVEIAPFLAVFDDAEVRRLYDPSQWASPIGGAFLNRRNDYREYLNLNADRVHFNRYTGVVMK
jgi:prepilin-type N-terminal cleavage/methylation domain-containing protein